MRDYITYIVGAIVAIVIIAIIAWLSDQSYYQRAWIAPKAFLDKASINDAEIGAKFRDDNTLLLIIKVGGEWFVQTYTYEVLEMLPTLKTLMRWVGMEYESEVLIKYNAGSGSSNASIGAIIPDGQFQIKVAGDTLVIYDTVKNTTLLMLWSKS